MRKTVMNEREDLLTEDGGGRNYAIMRFAPSVEKKTDFPASKSD